MEVILREHVDHLGRRGDVVKVAAGYARNYLLPRKLALAVNEGNKRQIERERKNAEARELEEKSQAEAFAARLARSRTSRFARRVGENDTLYGSVTSGDIAPALAAKGFEIDQRKITLAEPLKALGEVTVPVKIHRDVTAQVKVRSSPRRSSRLKRSFRLQAEGHFLLHCGRPRSMIGAPLFFSTTPWLTSPHPTRTLPHNLDAEKSVLGAILIHNDAFNDAAEVIDARDFFRDAHRRIFDRMVALSERGDAIDFVTLKEELSRRGELDEVGGPAYIASLADGVPRSANVEYYAKIVKEKSTLRSLIHSANKILADAYEAEDEPDLLLDERRARDLRDRRRSDPRRVRSAARSGAEQLHDHREAAAAQGTGHRRADRLRRPRRDDVRPAALGSRARGGASVDGQDQLRAEHRAARRHVDRHDGRASSASRCRRSSCSCACSRPRRASTRTGSAPAISNEKDYGRLSHALGTLAEARVFIDDTASIGVLEMRAKARRLKAEHGLHLLIIDYIQLMQGRGRFESRQTELASISRSLKGLAKELQRADRRAVAAVARAGDALRSPAAALRPARVRRARTGRRRRDVHLPRGAVPRRRRQRRTRKPRGRPRSSSASSATARSAPRSSPSSRNTRGSRTSRTERSACG